jgi:hypothetical protein
VHVSVLQKEKKNGNKQSGSARREKTNRYLVRCPESIQARSESLTLFSMVEQKTIGMTESDISMPYFDIRPRVGSLQTPKTGYDGREIGL